MWKQQKSLGVELSKIFDEFWALNDVISLIELDAIGFI